MKPTTTNTPGYRPRRVVEVVRGPLPEPEIPRTYVTLHTSPPLVPALRAPVQWSAASGGVITNAEPITWNGLNKSVTVQGLVWEGGLIPFDAPVNVNGSADLSVGPGQIRIEMATSVDAGGFLKGLLSPALRSPQDQLHMKAEWTTEEAAQFAGVSVKTWLTYMSRDRDKPFTPKPVTRGRGRGHKNIYKADDVKRYLRITKLKATKKSPFVRGNAPKFVQPS